MDSIGDFECDTILLLLLLLLLLPTLKLSCRNNTWCFTRATPGWFKISFPQERDDPSSIHLDDEDFEDDDDSDRLGTPTWGDHHRGFPGSPCNSGSSNMGNSCDHLRMGRNRVPRDDVMCVFWGARITVSNYPAW